MQIDEWIYDKLAEIEERLPELTHADPASFSCGHNAGYKKCVLDIVKLLNEQNTDADVD